MEILVERVTEVSRNVWGFLPPVDPYYAQISDLRIWRLYENFADVLSVADLVVALNMPTVRVDHVNAQEVRPFVLGHRGCVWRYGYRHMSYTAMNTHIHIDFPPALVHS